MVRGADHPLEALSPVRAPLALARALLLPPVTAPRRVVSEVTYVVSRWEVASAAADPAGTFYVAGGSSTDASGSFTFRIARVPALWAPRRAGARRRLTGGLDQPSASCSAAATISSSWGAAVASLAA